MSDLPRAAVVTVSDGVSSGARTDESGDTAMTMLQEAGFSVGSREVVPDERDRIEEVLRRLAQDHALVVTTGGTGFGPRDVTPEATKAVLDRDAPGLAELMRAEGLRATPMAALSRAAAGAIGSALVLNLPGSPRGVRESLGAVLPVIPHAVELLSGTTGPHPTGHGASHDPGPGSTPHAWVDAKAVKIVTGSPPCEVGSAMRIEPGGPVQGTLGCAEFDAAAVAAASEVLEAGRPDTRVFAHDLGEVEVYLEPHPVPRQAAVVSATDVARALRGHLQRLGYRTVLVESRVERLASGDEPAVRAVGDLDLGTLDAIVLTDHDAPEVAGALEAALRSPIPFIGVMGSRRHVGHYVEALRARGFDEGDLDRIRSPLGLDIGGRGVEEIALSIAAGVVAGANRRDGGWLDR